MSARFGQGASSSVASGRSFPVRCLLVFWLLGVSAALAQDVQVQVGRGPHYVGEPITVQVVANGFEEEPTPEIEAPRMNGATLRFAGVSPSVSSSISIVNGRMSRSKEVRFVYRYELRSARDGRVQIPAFVVRQGAQVRSTEPRSIVVRSVPTTGLISVELDLPEGPLFVGQKVPVAIVLRIDREAERDLLSLSTQVPLFETPTLRFLDDPADTEASLDVQTSEGVLRLPATATEEVVGGRVIRVLRAERTMIATAAEPLEVLAPRAVISRGTRFRRDLFGQRQATDVERLMAEGQARRIEVLEVPAEGRPPTFAGAVGEGFTLDVQADRSVVQVGEPIVVTFRVQGDGDLSTAGLPPFDAPGFLDPNQFRLPEEPPAGLVDDEGKRFEVSLRVLDAGVVEIPALEYAWFDAATRRFETTHSRPIALSVGAAQIVGAEDVDRAAGDPAATDELLRPRSGSEPAPPRVVSWETAGANLAIETDPDRVLGSPPALTALDRVLVPIGYGLGLATLLFAAFDRRRRNQDPGDRARRSAFEAARGQLSDSAATGPGGAAHVGRSLRELVAAQPDLAGGEVDALIAECDALRFAPGGENATPPSALVERARDFVSKGEAVS